MKNIFKLLIPVTILITLFGCSFNKSYDISIVIPAGSQEEFVYSEEEISPRKDKITLSAGNGLSDCLIVLKPIAVKEENAYEPTYITPGISVKMNAEKGAWFRVGVSIQNPTEQDIKVYVKISGVDVRIAETIATEIPQEPIVTENPKENTPGIKTATNTVSELSGGKVQTELQLSGKDVETLSVVLGRGEWTQEEAPDCITNCVINLDDVLYYYHFDCGTFTVPKSVLADSKTLKLSERDKLKVNSLLLQYISLETNL